MTFDSLKNPDTSSKEKIQKEEIKLEFSEASPSDPDYNDAIPVSVYSKDTTDIVESRLREMLKQKYWFLKDYWRQKTLKEKFAVTIGQITIEMYNFGNKLTEDQLIIIRNALQEYSSLQSEVFKKVRAIVFDDHQPINPNTGENQNGEGGETDGAVKIYPSALHAVSHRISGALNLEGTLIHELSHSVGLEFINEWRNKFEWISSETTEMFPGGALRYEVPKEPERCVTDYARVNAREDVSESIVAALKNPNILDPEKLQFIKSHLPISSEKLVPSIIAKTKGDISLPEIPQPVRYKRISRKRWAILT